jgi:hypothetical protein
LTWNTSNVYRGYNLSYAWNLVKNNVPKNTNTTTYYWLDAPEGIESGVYNGTIYVKANETG